MGIRSSLATYVRSSRVLLAPFRLRTALSYETDRLLRYSRENGRQFLFFKEAPSDHWYTGAGIGISFP